MDNALPEARADEATETLAARCAVVVARLSAERRWGLDAAIVARYAQAIVPHLRAGCAEELIARAACYYHTEHPIVLALRESGRPEHHATGERWVKTAARELHLRGLGDLSDQAIDIDDLVQEALAELARQLPRYRYEARFSVWAYQVIVTSALSQLERSRAKKRQAVRIPLDLERHGEIADPQQVEDQVWTRVFARYAAQTLSEVSPDRRLSQVLILYAADDRTLREIGALLGLSHTRVKGLLDKAVAILRDHQGVRSWHTDLGDGRTIAADRGELSDDH